MPTAVVRFTLSLPLTASCACMFLPANSGTNPAVKPAPNPAAAPNGTGVSAPNAPPAIPPFKPLSRDEPVPPTNPPRYSSPVLKSFTS